MTESIFKKGKIRSKGEGKTNRFEDILSTSLVKETKISHGRIFASKAGLCARQTAVTPNISPSEKETQKTASQFYFKIGSSFEDVFKRSLKAGGIYLADEVRVEACWDDVPISGRVDFVVNDPISSEMLLVELKSCGELPVKPKEYHLAQLKVYLAITGMNKGLVWYMSRHIADFKGTLKQRCFTYEISDDEREEVLTTMVRGSLYARDGLIPPRPENMRKSKCGFCPLTHLCWDSGKELKINARKADLEEEVLLEEEIKRKVKEAMVDQEALRKEFIDHFEIMGG